MGRLSSAYTLLTALLAGCVGPPAGSAPAPPPEETAPRAELVELSSRARPEVLDALRVTGVNKPNGIEYRLRRSVPSGTPAWIPRELDGLSLWIADPVEDGWLAFYREPLGTSPGSLNARYRAIGFGAGGERRWELDLNRFLSRPTHLEIQDIRLRQGSLFFNEACQSYARDADGRCSALVRLDPVREEVVWRTEPLVSNDIFLPHDGLLVSGYGFTSEPDSLFLVAQATGEIVSRAGLDTAHSYLEMVDGELVVITRRRVYRFAVEAGYPSSAIRYPSGGVRTDDG